VGDRGLLDPKKFYKICPRPKFESGLTRPNELSKQNPKNKTKSKLERCSDYPPKAQRNIIMIIAHAD
jgi:hypothetical protein